jgi:hypothetical protein
MNQLLLNKLTDSMVLNVCCTVGCYSFSHEIPCSYETLKFIIIFTKALQWFLLYVSVMHKRTLLVQSSYMQHVSLYTKKTPWSESASELY